MKPNEIILKQEIDNIKQLIKSVSDGQITQLSLLKKLNLHLMMINKIEL